jgi:hypothetical protein
VTTRRYTAWVAIELVADHPETDIERERSTIWGAVNRAVASMDLTNRLQRSFDERAFSTDLRTSEIVVRVTSIDVDDVDHPEDITQS